MKARAKHIQSSAPDPEAELEFALLGAAPISVDVLAQKVLTPFPALIGRILRAPANTAPILTGDITHLFRDSIQDQRKEAIRELPWDGARYKIKYALEALDGETIWIEESGERVSGTGNRAHYIQGVLRDVSAQNQSRSEILHQARFDGLTGTLSKKAMIEALEHEVRFTGDSDHPSYCLVVSIDNLPDINTLYGHRAGDFCLKSTAQDIELFTSQPNVIGRLSGHQFGIIIPHNIWVENQGNRLDLEARLFNRPISSDFGTIILSGTIDAIPAGCDSMVRLLGRIRPTNTQRKQVFPSPAGQTPDEFSAEDINKLIADDHITLAYQPIVDAGTGTPVHFECLMRIVTQTGEYASAWKLILDAEKLGMVHRLDLRALDIAKETLQSYPDLKLALNVSAGTVKHGSAYTTYIEKLKDMGSMAHRLTLELTETLALENSLEANKFAAAARSLGCKFAIDDFGAGYTSFANLMSIEADVIKIDGTFVRDIARQKHKQTFVRLIVDLARTLGVKTVAEMVDNPADAKLLRHLDVDYLQGYYFGYPGVLPEAK